MRIKIGTVMLLLALLLPFSRGLATQKQAAADDLTTLSGLQAYFTADKQLGVQSGTILDQMAAKHFPDAQRVYMPGSSDLVAALTTGKIDGYLVDQPQGYAQCLSDDRLWMPDVRIEEDHYGIALAFGQEALCEQLNELIGEMKAAGELDALSEKWFLTDETQKPMAALPATGEHGVLKLATSADSYPFSYMREGQPVGYSVELFGMLCEKLGYGCEVQVYDFGGMIAAIAAGKANAASDSISITAERKEQMLFTNPTYDGGVAMILPSALKPQADASADLSTEEGAFAWLRGKRVGMFIGATVPADVEEKLSASEQVWLNNNVDMMSALSADKIDAFLCEVPIARQICAENEGLYTPETILIPEAYAFALRGDNTALAGLLNDFIRRLTADGTLEKLQAKWEQGDPAERVMPQATLTGENGTLTIATDAADAPFGYVQNGELVGYDYELLTLFAKEYGYTLEYLQIAWDALPAAVVSGKCDIACGCLSVTDEHTERLLMTDPTYRSGVTLVMSDQYAPHATQEEPKAEDSWAAFAASISASFERTFLRENRWMLIVQGLLTTLEISVLSALLGTLLGFGVCMMRRSRLRVLSGLAKVFVSLMQGTPIVVFLMILYYIVFGDVDPILVAVVGFGLNFGAYVSEMMRTGIDAVDKGQIEAASAIGFTKAQTFLRITLPQAARHFLPVFRGEFISLVKTTSVVGYISIMDLTKMSDIIRSRTYEAFFPLIATAVIYFALSWLLARVLTTLEKRIDPKRRKRTIKGVREEKSAC